MPAPAPSSLHAGEEAQPFSSLSLVSPKEKTKQNRGAPSLGHKLLEHRDIAEGPGALPLPTGLATTTWAPPNSTIRSLTVQAVLKTSPGGPGHNGDPTQVLQRKQQP